ncbi:hypothetical protein AKJ41_00635 [candidate division MSBL1 archaeon SCGC-AAA259O05]|uniref:Uncharacterized protein n=1 Tax=candidate division MSBL1 archaeon SCGC-AAA259O05 TaxID=1698271 RepID=A0A133V5H4_9EURY|nr:hypothetical protein AKJ41_00635 [candidate division MSBL1 archaeon SCGC-AAA259O05]
MVPTSTPGFRMTESGSERKINEELERAELGKHLSWSALLTGIFLVFLALCFLITNEPAHSPGAEDASHLVLASSPPWWALPLFVGSVILFLVSVALVRYFGGRAGRIRSLNGKREEAGDRRLLI